MRPHGRPCHSYTLDDYQNRYCQTTDIDTAGVVDPPALCNGAVAAAAAVAATAPPGRQPQ